MRPSRLSLAGPPSHAAHPGSDEATGAQRVTRCFACRYGVGDDVSDWTVEKITVSGKMRSNESVLQQVTRCAFGGGCVG